MRESVPCHDVIISLTHRCVIHFFLFQDPVPDHENRQRALRELYLQYANDPSRQKKVEPDSPYLGKRKSQEEKFNAHLLAMDKFTNLLDMQLRLLESTDEDLRESDKEMVKVYVNKWKTKSGMGTENWIIDGVSFLKDLNGTCHPGGHPDLKHLGLINTHWPPHWLQSLTHNVLTSLWNANKLLVLIKAIIWHLF